MSNHEKRLVTFIEGNGSPLRSRKQGRNETCTCGSGKKAKKCCGNKTEWFHSKDRERPKPSEEEKSKEDGIKY